jgi:CheY-like chemotaxis protein
MDPQVLIIFGDHDEFDNTCRILREGLLNDIGKIEVDWAKNADMAIYCLSKKQYQLVIADLHIPQDHGAAVIEEAMSGIELLKNIQKDCIPSFLVVPARTTELQEVVDDLHRCRLVEKGSGYREQLLRFSRMFLQKPHEKIAGSDVEKEGKIDLELDLNNNFWHFNIIGEFGDSVYMNEGLLEIRSDKIMDLIDRSSNIQVIPNWEKELEQIGKTLCEQIIENNKKFMKAFYKLTGAINQLEKIRIRFKVDRKIHPVFLEALIEDESFLMLSSPVYRRLSVSGEYHPIFKCPGSKRHPVNCLIIESDFWGTAGTADIRNKFDKLENIAWEALWLHDFLEDNRKAFNIGEIKWVRNTPENGCFTDHLRELFCPGRTWELVHYAGHSYYDGISGKGYLLFPPNDDPEVVRLQEFSKWLRDCKNQLVFLSSCHSSEEDFVFELAQNGIPSIIGFRWNIDDEKAVEYVKTFYTHLFRKGLTLEYAFLETRRDMHDKFPKNRIWAAPMLIIQEN